MSTLRQAIDTMGARGVVRSRSDQGLAMQVADLQREHLKKHPGLPTKAVVSPATGLDRPLDARPIAVMMELARGTALNVSNSVASFGQRWSALKYLGLFENDLPTGDLRLNPMVLAEVGANQRRVISEELGIGFAALAAKQWCRSRHAGVGLISVVDVDRVLLNGSMPALQQVGRRQPDYLLVFDDPTTSGGRRVELLECKGTVSQANARSQLGRAVTQLAGLTVNGRHLTGLAVSTVATEDGITLFAVDPEDEPVSYVPTKASTDRWRDDQTDRKGDDPVVDVDRDELTAKATNVEFASLTEFAGLLADTEKWLPNFGRDVPREVATERKPGPDRSSFVGQEFVVRLGQETLRVFQGVSSDVADELRSLDPTAVLEAQRAVRPSSDDIEDALKRGVDADAVSAVTTTQDGAVLQLTVE